LSDLLRFDIPYPLQWGPPSFSADHSFGMMAAVLVSLVEVRASHLQGNPLKHLPIYFLSSSLHKTSVT
jgi:hypothetical protein